MYTENSHFHFADSAVCLVLAKKDFQWEIRAIIVLSFIALPHKSLGD